MKTISSIFVLLFCFVFVCPATAKLTEANADTVSSEGNLTELEEVIILAGGERYSKKNNPAIELIRETRKKAYESDPFNRNHYSYDFHDKIDLALNEVEIGENTAENLKYLKKYEDIAANTLRPILLMSLKEKIGTRITQKDAPGYDKTIVSGTRYEGVDKSFDQENITKALEQYIPEIDIFKNELPLMSHHFISPFSSLGPEFYKYYITDTISFPNDTLKYVELRFSPFSPESFGFIGTIYVATDTTRFVKEVNMRVPRVLNLNYVDNIFINLEYELDSLGNRHKTFDDVTLELQLISGTPTFYARRTSAKTNFSYEKRDEFEQYLKHPLETLYVATPEDENNDLLWNQMRIIPLSKAEMEISHMNREMKTSPLFYWGEKIVLILANGYIGTGYKNKASKFDFGPINTFISYNDVEGVRLRAGGMTTGSLSRHVFARGYIAYGFKDHKWKYQGEFEYSFTPKKEHSREFPMNSIRAQHSYDLDMLGEHFKFANHDNIFLSINRRANNLATYRRLTDIRYILELKNHFSIETGIRHQIQYATKFIPFVNGNNIRYNNFSQSAFFIKLRFAPGEKFYQGRNTRTPINLDVPVVELTHEYGPKGFLGAAFTTNITQLAVQKRFWLSMFGYVDVILQGGKIWNQVQFPALLWPNANLTYTLQPETYTLMNPMEFANDWYGSLDLSYFLDGLILNRIPLIKKAKLREILTFKMLMGGLTNKNNPEFNANLYRFPFDSDTYLMTRKPYMEIGVGLDNILTLFRLDYVWRLTYRDHPGINRGGLRVSLHFNF